MSDKITGIEDFTASNGWLESFKGFYGIRETRIVGEGDDVPVMTVKAWLERLPELTEGYSSSDIINMDEFAVFFKALPDKGLREKGKSSRGGKKSKLRITGAIFVSLDGEKVCDPIIIGRSAKPRCFKKLKDLQRPHNANYFSNKKAWMNSDLMKTFLTRLDRKFLAENRKVILFMDNATCHPPTLQDGLVNINLKFLPKNTTSKLQPCDAGIIQALKSRYRKLLLRHVIARVSDGKRASEIADSVNILTAIRWLMDAWRSLPSETIVKCFEKCGFKSSVSVTTSDQIVDEEFEGLFKELTGSSSGINEYIDFDREVQICENSVDTSSVSWREDLRRKCIKLETEEVPDAAASASDDDKDDDQVPDEPPKASDVLQMLDKIQNFVDYHQCDHLQNTVSELVKSVEKLQISGKKQSDIRLFFTESLTA